MEKGEGETAEAAAPDAKKRKPAGEDQEEGEILDAERLKKQRVAAPAADAADTEQPAADAANPSQSISEAEILRLLRVREVARQAKDFATADAHRETLRAHGVEIYDKQREWRCADGRSGLLHHAGAAASASCKLTGAEIAALVAQREEHRAAKDWSAADRCRESLRAQGVELYDKEKIWRASDGQQGHIGIKALGPSTSAPTEAEIMQLLVQREAARAAKDWATADTLRDGLRERGVELYDATGLWKVRRRDVHDHACTTPPCPTASNSLPSSAEDRRSHVSAVAVCAADGWVGVCVCRLSCAGRQDSRGEVGLMPLPGGQAHVPDAAIVGLIEHREMARKARDWAAADKIRDQLRARGVELYDKRSEWKASDGRVGSMAGGLAGGRGAAFAMGGGGGGGGVGAGHGLGDAEVVALLQQREAYRASKNWPMADSIRATLRVSVITTLHQCTACLAVRSIGEKRSSSRPKASRSTTRKGAGPASGMGVAGRLRARGGAEAPGSSCSCSCSSSSSSRWQLRAHMQTARARGSSSCNRRGSGQSSSSCGSCNSRTMPCRHICTSSSSSSNSTAARVGHCSNTISSSSSRDG
eukprot:COSAG01_NODE_4514_length_4962_cov_71.882171_2_plen_589_part_00